MGDFEEMFTLHAVIMLCFIFVTMLPNMFDDSSTGTRGLHRSPSQLCLIKRIDNFTVSYLIRVMSDSYSISFV
jgi:hypothetical protein